MRKRNPPKPKKEVPLRVLNLRDALLDVIVSNYAETGIVFLDCKQMRTVADGLMAAGPTRKHAVILLYLQKHWREDRTLFYMPRTDREQAFFRTYGARIGMAAPASAVVSKEISASTHPVVVEPASPEVQQAMEVLHQVRETHPVVVDIGQRKTIEFSDPDGTPVVIHIGKTVVRLHVRELTIQYLPLILLFLLVLGFASFSKF